MASTIAPLSMTTALSSDPANPGQHLPDEQLKENGIEKSSHLQKSSPRPKYSQSLKIALETVAKNRRDSSDVSESESLEDYDTLKPDPMSIITGGKGGGLDLETDPAPSKNGKEHYTFEADDDELRDLLKGTVAHYSQDNTPGEPKKRVKFSDLVFTKKFTAFDRHNNIVANSPFHGFFTLVLGLSDGVMCLATGFGLFLQKFIRRGYLSWNREGWIIQSAWELSYLALVVSWTLFREWPWTHTVFFVLHGIVMIMKQHSYAFYNGHLSEEYTTRSKLQRKLKQLENVSPVQTPSATTPAVASLSTSYLDSRPTSSDVRQRVSERRHSVVASNTDQVAAAIDSGEPLDLDQIQTFARILKWEIDFLEKELQGKCSASGNSYPNNLSVANHYEYIVLPTLVYELEYPRSDSIDWYNVAEKTIATAGLLIVMNLISQTYIYPIVVQTIDMKEAGMTLYERLSYFPGIISDLAFPFLAEYILTWYVIWECILNLLAELTCYADRGFYEAWWNSVSWDQFARDWNRPVHNFLLRHVYHSSISSLKVNKYTATLITFFLSACVHELVMWCIFKKLRGYLLFLQMCQIPLTMMCVNQSG
ncbi:hypothetical protein EYC84_001641 [Monilinia fructicola]|uniref:O-acyltransferase n=1 Tax=Monilinia fructicola TaxID=38448 RepID=A0A5M9JQ57_MONFR|nr:hypothetical protein EYC84_001641 [Monilinia fructicola]